MAIISGAGFYTVKRGDTLTKIANAYNTTPAEIARLNNLSNINFIKVGDHLYVKPGTPKKQETPKTDNHESYIEEACNLYFKFVDAVEKPIAKLKVWIKAGAQELEHLTDFGGSIPPVQVEKGARVEVQVNKAAGGKKTVSAFKAEEDASIIIPSPKIKIEATQKRKGNPPKSNKKEPELSQPGDISNTHTNDGLLQKVISECPNEYNLRLGANYKYRDFIIAAHKRTGMDAVAVACLIDAEASKISKRKPKLDKKGKPVINKKTGKIKTIPDPDNSEWNPEARNPKSSATGLTQFTDDTWISMAFINGTFLNDWVKGQKWLTTTTVKDSKKGKTGTTLQAFVLSDGSLAIPQKVKKNGKYVYLGLDATLANKYTAGRRRAKDRNLQYLLDLRNKAEYSIHTAMDYAVLNMKLLIRQGFTKIDGLNDGEKAKIMYLAHHLGGDDTPRFIDNEITAENAKKLLKGQIDEDDAEKKAKDAGGDWVKAHRKWLEWYVDGKIILKNRMCQNRENLAVRKLLAITDSIKRR